MLVKDIMSSPVISVKKDDTVGKAMEIMKTDEIRHLPVVDRDGKLIGIIAERDILKVFPPNKSLDKFQINLLSRTPVTSIMSSEPVTVSPPDTLEHAAMAMEKRDVGCVPVVDNGHLVGLISESDIFNSFIEALGIDKPGLRITLKLQRRKGFLAELVQIFDSNQAIIDNFVTFADELVLKVRSDNEAIILKELITNGFEVLHLAKDEFKADTEVALSLG